LLITSDVEPALVDADASSVTIATSTDDAIANVTTFENRLEA
jgi:hypothetical protein